MTTQAVFLGRLIERLEKAGIPYMVAGSEAKGGEDGDKEGKVGGG